VDLNEGGEKAFVVGAYNPAYGLGTYGLDPRTKTAWAVINYEGDFAVARNIDDDRHRGPHRKHHRRNHDCGRHGH